MCSVLTGYDQNTGGAYQAQGAANIERRNKIELGELKKLQAGEGMLIFKDAVIPASSYIPDDHKKTSKLSARINRFLQIERRIATAAPKCRAYQ